MSSGAPSSSRHAPHRTETLSLRCKRQIQILPTVQDFEPQVLRCGIAAVAYQRSCTTFTTIVPGQRLPQRLPRGERPTDPRGMALMYHSLRLTTEKKGDDGPQQLTSVTGGDVKLDLDSQVRHHSKSAYRAFSSIPTPGQLDSPSDNCPGSL